MGSRLLEKQHEEYLEKFVYLIGKAKEIGDWNLLEKICNYALDNLNIARAVGFVGLSERYREIFANEFS